MDPISCKQECRICGSHGTDYTSIFEANSDCIDEKINQCLPISVSKYDKRSSYICSECLNALIINDRLRKKSLKSDKLLREQFHITEVDIKIEKHHSDDDDDPIHCGICEINFDNALQFDEHMKKSHSQWNCNLCNENFKTSDDLSQHKYTNHDDNMEDDDEADENIDRLGSEGDASIDDDESIEIKDEPPPPIPKNSSKSKKSLKNAIICDICNVRVQNQNHMFHHRKFHGPRAMTCWTCDITYPSPYDFYLHKRDVHKHFKGPPKMYCCDNCESITSSFRTFYRHINCKYVKLKCQYCDREFVKGFELVIHQRKYHKEEMKDNIPRTQWNCPVCDKPYFSALGYNNHMRWHSKTNPDAHKCEQCGKVFGTPGLLGTHVEDVHGKAKKYRCNLCPKTFKTRRTLLQHKNKHRTCKECDKLFANMRDYNAHMKKEHNGNGSTQKTSEQKSKDRENMNSEEGPHMCIICHKEFRTYTAKLSHQRRHNDDNVSYTCDYCKIELKDKDILRRHIYSHLPREDWKYVCKVCNVKCQTAWFLRSHIKEHSAPSR